MKISRKSVLYKILRFISFGNAEYSYVHRYIFDFALILFLVAISIGAATSIIVFILYCVGDEAIASVTNFHIMFVVGGISLFSILLIFSLRFDAVFDFIDKIIRFFTIHIEYED